MSSAQPSPGPSASSLPPAAPSRGRPSGLGVTAGAAEDKYRVKVRELKAKIRAVEQDNDKMYTKTLEAKRNIQRLRIERAIIYERLNAGPPQPPPSPPQPLYRDVVLAPTDVEGADYYRKRDIPVRPEIDPHTGQYIQVARAPAPPPTSSSRSRHLQQASPLDTLPPSTSHGYYPPPPPPGHTQPPYAPPNSHHASPGRAPAPPTRHERHSPPPSHRGAHQHQRLGPGAIISHDAERDQQRIRDWEVEQARRHQGQQQSYPYDRASERPYDYSAHHGHLPPPHYRDEREREYSHSHAHHALPYPSHAHHHSGTQAELTRARSGSNTSHAHVPYERERDVEMDDRTNA